MMKYVTTDKSFEVTYLYLAGFSVGDCVLDFGGFMKENTSKAFEYT